MIRVVEVLVCSFLVTGSLFAQDPRADEKVSEEKPDTDPDVPMDEIVIVATRVPTATFDVPYPVQTVPALAGTSARSPRTVTDALGDLPQIMVQKTGYGQASPFLRGFTGFRTLILVDGIRLNNSVFRDGPNQYATLIDPLALARGEVVFGPSSVLYGSDAIGGTMSYTTQTPELSTEGVRYGGRVYQRYASAEESSVSRLESYVASPRVAVQVAGSYRDFDDFSAGRHQGVLENTGYREWSGDAKLVANLTEDFDLILAFQRHRQDDVPRTHSTIFSQSYRGTEIGDDIRRDLTEMRDLAYARVTWEPGEDRSAELTVYRYLLDEEENRVRANSRKRVQGFDDTTLGATVHYFEATPIGRVSAGVEYSREGVDSFFREFNADGSLGEVRTRGPVADQATYQTLSVYLEDKVEVAEWFELSIGGRFTHVEVDADEVDPDPADSEVLASINDDFSDVVGSLRGLFRVSDSVNLFAGVSQAFRAPNLSDLTRFDAARSGEAEIPAPGLDSEHFVTFEIGGKIRADAFELGASYYYTFIEDLIVRVPTGGVNADGDTVVTKDNAGDGFAHGVEVTASVNLPHELTVFGGFAWVEGEAEILSQSGLESDEPLSRLAPPTGTLGIRYEPAGKGVTLETDVRIAGDADRLSPRDAADTQRIPPGGTPGYAVLGVRGSWEPKEGLRVFAGIENLTDQDFRIHGSGSNEIGINFVAGVDWRF